MNLYKLPIEKLSEYNTLLDLIKRDSLPCLAVGLSSVHKANFISGISDSINRPILVVTPDELSARKLTDDISQMLKDKSAEFFPAKELVFRDMETVSGEYEQIRLGVLSRIIENSAPVIVASVDSLMQYTIPKTELDIRSQVLSCGQNISHEKVVRILQSAGYTRRPQIDSVAQYSVRGGIIDLFPPHSSKPIRVEFWGDEIDTISTFDIDTQRREDTLESIKISPASEVVFSSEEELAQKLKELTKALEKRKSAQKSLTLIQKDIEKLESKLKLSTYDKYLRLAYEKPSTILDYLENPIVIFSEFNDCKERAHGAFSRYSEDVKILLEEGEINDKLLDLYVSPAILFSDIEKNSVVYFESFTRSMNGIKLKSILNINALQNSGWSGNLSALCEDLKPLVNMGYCCAVLSGTAKSAATLAKDLTNEGIPADFVSDIPELVVGKVYVLHGSISAGFEYPDAKFTLITNTSTRPFKINRSKKRKGEEIKSLSDLNQGDLVVHASHGIGVFDGINQLNLHGVKKDYIKIKYAGADTLYIPVTQLDLVSKYIGPQNEERVKLNKLNSGEWQKAKTRVKAAVADMAEELIRLYSARMQTKGFAFDEDNEWQQQFEEHFPYEETQDQLRCVAEIKNDMQRSAPMDRLLCADVGFGKTEVALRAAFKCVMSSKQCAILCPTTILAWQHYQNIVQRMEGFPINIQLLSRFRTPKQQRETIKGLKNGTVDIVIGTHRLVQKDIEFKDLGLAIIDEEQRFGVKHKERFKEMFNGVDMLSLSATPIPRTLNMAMSGIRDMSVIEEAPQDRFPVQTYVLEYEPGVISDAIGRELARGGQVYYIHNRIESIELCASKIRQSFPDARVGIAHGKMGEEQLSDIWKQLVENEIDVLVCTTLIETGIDVANCNTLIIEDADNMGLAQLYQLRGRVGRSSRRAYAYFTFRRGKALTEVAAKRLTAIREFTKFGSGFRIALRDLEIRGAGSMLGARQHGHLEAVGYDMYIRLLTDAIAECRGEKPKEEPEECLVDISMDAHIPERYIDNISQRLEVYRKIAAVKTEQESFDVMDELIDRFGEPPKSVQGLIDIALLRNAAAENGIIEMRQQGKEIVLKTKELNMEMVGILTGKFKSRVTVNAGTKPYIAVKMLSSDKPIDTIRSIILELQEKRTINNK